jgi:hypothetical protein
MIHNDTLTLTDEATLAYAHERLKQNLDLKADGYICTVDDLVHVLLALSVNQSTLQAVCSDLVGTPDPTTVRGYLNEQLRVEQLDQLEQAFNQALQEDIPARVCRKALDIAIDLHDRAYYGKLSQEEGLWVRGQAKDGTTRFYRIATVYLIAYGLRFTLALYFVRPDDDLVTVLTNLLAQIKEFGLSIRRLLLDRGFASIEVQEYLDQQGIPAVICCPIRGKNGGTRALCKGRKGYRTTHTFKSKGRQRTAQLAVCRVFTTVSRTTGLKRKATWWVFILIHLDLSPNQVRRLYRHRFGIETSYRCAAKVRGWTTSANPAYRFSLMAIAILLLNVWTILRWRFTQLPRRGGRLLDDKLFQLSRFANFINRALLQRYDYVRHITAVAAPLM